MAASQADWEGRFLVAVLGRHERPGHRRRVRTRWRAEGLRAPEPVGGVGHGDRVVDGANGGQKAWKAQRSYVSRGGVLARGGFVLGIPPLDPGVFWLPLSSTRCFNPRRLNGAGGDLDA